MGELNTFFNDKMRVLIVINSHIMRVEEEEFCPLSQQEIASLVPCGKVKANQLINELIKEGYIETLRIKGRYSITLKGKEILKKIT